jgi:hypothetical protein
MSDTAASALNANDVAVPTAIDGQLACGLHVQ